MQPDPYRVLGVKPSNSDEEIKSAYRELVKKYHPDRYANSPLQNQAQEKLKDINLAYDTIVKQRENGGYTGGGYGSAGPSWDFHQETRSSGRFADIREMITRGLIEQAEAALERMQERNAEWHYLRGIVYMRRGWYAQAQQSFDTAVYMDPGNAEYQNAAKRMQGAFNNPWQARGNVHSFTSTPCFNICAVLTCCSMCGGGGFMPMCCFC